MAPPRRKGDQRPEGLQSIDYSLFRDVPKDVVFLKWEKELVAWSYSCLRTSAASDRGMMNNIDVEFLRIRLLTEGKQRLIGLISQDTVGMQAPRVLLRLYLDTWNRERLLSIIEEIEGTMRKGEGDLSPVLVSNKAITVIALRRA